LKVTEHFEVEYYQFLRFNPQKNLSSGEEMMLNLISLLFENKNSQKPSALPFILFLDEADLGFHPNWKKKFIFSLAKVLPIIYKNRMIQIIFTTHEPLTLSDLPNNNVVYLIKKEGKTEVAKDSERPQKSFGANITDLLADSFFIEDGLIGDFAKSKISDVIEFLNKRDSKIETKEEAKQIIEIIDEPLMKNKLLEMYFNLFPEEYDIEKEKDKIRKRAIELGLIPE
jgi:predicted ATP-binding protein involved in virulence